MNTSLFDLFGDSIFLVIKAMTILALVVYMIFAFILISQIKNTRQAISTELGPFLELLTYIHFLLSVGLIILAFVLL